MPSGLVALLDDIAVIAKAASASIDDVAVAAGKAGTKTAGVVIDDAAVTPSYVTGLSPARELPIIWKITKGSLRNKLLFLLPGALLLSEFLPGAIIWLLMLGGAFLCYEGAEKVMEKLGAAKHGATLDDPITDPVAFENERVGGRSAPISSSRPKSWPSRLPRWNCRPGGSAALRWRWLPWW